MSLKTSNNNATIAFTLPISCQICLGKVKKPVVCPNQHVFCGPCMELWLERNKQCPACRIYITEENPCRQVLGGLNPECKPSENFSSKELRRARMELIYKDYENEIDRLEAELEATKQDTRELRIQMRNQAVAVTTKTPSPTQSVTSDQDRTTISLLNSKLKDATELYETFKTELSRCKAEITKLRDQNTNHQRENQSLRLELTGRSPRRFGRYTVAALESKLDTAEKQIVKLEKALEQSDRYIEDLEKDLDQFRCAKKTHRKMPKLDESDHDLDNSNLNDLDSSNLNDSELPSRISHGSEATFDVVSDVKFDESDMSLAPGNKSQSSFILEVPSPISKSSRYVTSDTEDSRNIGTEDSFQLPKPSGSGISEPTLDGCKKKLKFTFGEESSSNDFMSARAFPSMDQGDSSPTKNKVRFSVKSKSRRSQEVDMNVSITPDMEDCFRFMDEAEKKLEKQYNTSVGRQSAALISSTALNTATNPKTLFPRSKEVTHIACLSASHDSFSNGFVANFPTSQSPCSSSQTNTFSVNLPVVTSNQQGTSSFGSFLSQPNSMSNFSAMNNHLNLHASSKMFGSFSANSGSTIFQNPTISGAPGAFNTLSQPTGLHSSLPPYRSVSSTQNSNTRPNMFSQ